MIRHLAQYVSPQGAEKVFDLGTGSVQATQEAGSSPAEVPGERVALGHAWLGRLRRAPFEREPDCRPELIPR